MTAIMLLDIAAKSAVIVLIAQSLVWALHRSSAAARHAVWRTAMLGLLCLPLLFILLPGWFLHVLPPVQSHAMPTLQQTLYPVRIISDLTIKAEKAQYMSKFDKTPLSFVNDVPIQSRRHFEGLAGFDWICFIWTLGALFFLTRTLTSLLKLGRFISRCRLVETFYFTRPITVRVGLEGCPPHVPMVCGVINPVILLPYGSKDWSAERMRSVILHELAHVRRGDWLTMILMQIVCAIYWFNPFVWALNRGLRLEAEKACDDFVIGSGVSSVDYAQHLLEIARGLLPRDTQSAMVAMAHRPEIAQRLVSILNAKTTRRGLIFRERALCGMLLLSVTLFAAMHPVARRIAGQVIGSALANSYGMKLNLQLIQTLTTAAPVTCVAFTPSGSQILNGSETGFAFWSVPTGRQLVNKRLPAPLVAAAYSPDGRLMSTGYENGSLRLSDTKTGRVIRHLSLKVDAIKNLQFSPDGLTVACSASRRGEQANSLTLMNTESGALRGAEYHGIFHKLMMESQHMGFTVAPQTSRLVLWNPSVVLWSPRWGHPNIALGINAETCAASGSLLAVKTAHEIQIWNTVSRTLLASVPAEPDADKDASHLAFSSDGQYLAFGSADKIKVWHIRSVH